MAANGKYTLYELVTAILEKMDSDEVNSIFDTVESVGVANEVRDTFNSMVSNSEEYHKEEFVKIEAVSSFEHFNQMRVPENVVNVHQLWYNNCGHRVELVYMPPREFVDHCFSGTHDCETKMVEQYNKDNSPCFPVGTDRNPRYYTSFDGTTLFFDAVDLNETDTLKADDFSARVSVFPEFKMENNFVPPLRVDDFAYLLNDSIDACFINFKGVSNAKAQARARNQMVRGQNNRDVVGVHVNGTARPPYGRHSRGRSVRNISRAAD